MGGWGTGEDAGCSLADVQVDDGEEEEVGEGEAGVGEEDDEEVDDRSHEGDPAVAEAGVEGGGHVYDGGLGLLGEERGAGGPGRRPVLRLAHERRLAGVGGRRRRGLAGEALALREEVVQVPLRLGRLRQRRRLQAPGELQECGSGKRGMATFIPSMLP